MSENTNKHSQFEPVTIGFIGIGLMGDPMVRRLLEAGHNVHVWNRDPAKTKAVANRGAIVASDIESIVKRSDMILLCVSDTSAVEDIVFSKKGIAAFANDRQLLVDLSSIDPAKTVVFAQQLLNKCGMRWVDSPVSGGVLGAEQGNLSIMAGGEKADVDYVARHLVCLYQRFTHVGPIGAGQISKLCNQMIVGCNAMVIAEMIALARASGIDASKIPKALVGGFADSKPLQILGPQMANDQFEPIKWHVKTLLKDLDMAHEFSQQIGSSTPMSALAGQLMRLHGSQGYLDKDPATLIELFKSK